MVGSGAAGLGAHHGRRRAALTGTSGRGAGVVGVEETDRRARRRPGDGGTAVPADPARSGRVLAYALEGTAVALVVGLVLAGATVSAPAAWLVLVGLVALSTNRDTLFPSELAATTEVCVLLCTVVLSRDSSPLLAPVLLGLVSGWLDVHHWRSRASVRMAFNSGKNACAAGAAAGALAASSALAEPAGWSDAVAVLVACITFVVVDSGLLVGLLVLVRPGPALRGAVVDVARVDRCSPLYAVAGAGVGLAATTLPWWSMVPLLVPLVLAAPHVCPVAARRRQGTGRARIGAAVAVGAVTAAAATAVAVSAGAPAVVAAVVACTAVALGAECVVERDGGVFALAWPIAVTAAVTMEPGPAVVVAVSAGAAAIAVSAVLAQHRAVARSLVATSAAVAVAVSVFAALDGSTGSGPRAVAAAAAAGIAFWVVGVAAGPHRGVRAAAAAWTLPLIGAVTAIGMTAGTTAPGALVAGAGAVVLVVAACSSARWGSLPWRSRRLGHTVVGPRVAPGALAYGASVLALATWVGALVAHGEARAWWTAAVVACGDGAVAMVGVGARQWRFASRARRWGAAVVLAAAAVITIVVPSTLTRQQVWAGIALAAALGVTLWCGRRSAALAAAVSGATAHAAPTGAAPFYEPTERA